MKITDVDIVLHARSSSLAVFGVRDGKLPMGVLRITTDEGIVGRNFLSYPGPGPAAIADQIVTFAKPLLIGEDPLDIGRHWRRLGGLGHFVSPIVHGVVDVALWDIAGQAAGLPIHRLLGTCSDSAPVYFSSGHHARPEDYADEARYWKDERGWTGYKLHPPRAPWLAPPAPPIGVRHRGVRGRPRGGRDEMALMLDSSWSYTYMQALRVGRAIEELDYLWYEDPLPALDIHGYQRLKQHLHIPLLATEMTPGGLEALPAWITAGATDFLRGDVVIKGGITGLVKIAQLAEAFGMGCEVHDGYNALNNVANLHVILADRQLRVVRGARLQPQPATTASSTSTTGWPSRSRSTPRASCTRPTGPGLGVDVDWDLIDSAVDRVVS